MKITNQSEIPITSNFTEDCLIQLHLRERGWGAPRAAKVPLHCSSKPNNKYCGIFHLVFSNTLYARWYFPMKVFSAWKKRMVEQLWSPRSWDPQPTVLGGHARPEPKQREVIFLRIKPQGVLMKQHEAIFPLKTFLRNTRSVPAAQRAPKPVLTAGKEPRPRQPAGPGPTKHVSPPHRPAARRGARGQFFSPQDF